MCSVVYAVIASHLRRQRLLRSRSVLPGCKHPNALRGWLDAEGLVVEGRDAQQPSRRDAWVAHYERDGASPQLVREPDQRAQPGAVDERDVGDIERNGANVW